LGFFQKREVNDLVYGCAGTKPQGRSLIHRFNFCSSLAFLFGKISRLRL
jgi:hypothetical protein